jgi:hypothetical protein
MVVYNGGVELLALVSIFGDLELQKQAAATFAQLAVTGM